MLHGCLRPSGAWALVGMVGVQHRGMTWVPPRHQTARRPAWHAERYSQKNNLHIVWAWEGRAGGGTHWAGGRGWWDEATLPAVRLAFDTITLRDGPPAAPRTQLELPARVRGSISPPHPHHNFSDSALNLQECE